MATPVDARLKDFLVRAPTVDDLETVTELMRACELAEHGEAEATADDLLGEWRRSGFDPATDAWLVVTASGQVAAYADVRDRSERTQFQGDGCVHPDCRGRGIGAQLVRLMEWRARERMALAAPGARVTITNIVSHANGAARRLLEKAGYRPVRYYWRMEIQMEGPPAPPQWPAGIAVRNFVPGPDERAVYAAVQEAFRDNRGFVPTPFEDWSNFMTARETFDPGLWFLAMDGEEIAGAVLCPRYPNAGWVRQLVVRRPWRRRGVALALLRQALGEF